MKRKKKKKIILFKKKNKKNITTSSLTDIILTKINRNKSIAANDNHTLVSEGADGNYFDMLNYAVFYLIKLTTHNETK